MDKVFKSNKKKEAIMPAIVVMESDDAQGGGVVSMVYRVSGSNDESVGPQVNEPLDKSLNSYSLMGAFLSSSKLQDVRTTAALGATVAAPQLDGGDNKDHDRELPNDSKSKTKWFPTLFKKSQDRSSASTQLIRDAPPRNHSTGIYFENTEIRYPLQQIGHVSVAISPTPAAGLHPQGPPATSAKNCRLPLSAPQPLAAAPQLAHQLPSDPSTHNSRPKRRNTQSDRRIASRRKVTPNSERPLRETEEAVLDAAVALSKLASIRSVPPSPTIEPQKPEKQAGPKSLVLEPASLHSFALPPPPFRLLQAKK